MTDNVVVPMELVDDTIDSLHRFGRNQRSFILADKLSAALEAKPVEPVGRFRGREGEYGYFIIDLYDDIDVGVELYSTPPIQADQAARIAELEAKLAASEAARKEAEKDAVKRVSHIYWTPRVVGRWNSEDVAHAEGFNQAKDEAIAAIAQGKEQGE
jgi:hypothetical protein